jgi:hypothetical protein
VSKNFQAMKEFEEHLLAFRKQDVDRSSVEEILLSHFEEFFEKVSFFSLFFFIFFSFLFFFPFFFFFFAILLTLSTA